MRANDGAQSAIKTARVLHTVAGLNETFGGPSRTVPALCSALVPFVGWIGLASQTFPGNRGRLILPDADVAVAFSSGIYIDALRVAIGRPAANVRRIATSSHANIFHDHGLWQPFNHTVAVVARQLRATRIVSPRGMLMKWSMGNSPRRKALMWRLFQRRDLLEAHGFVATSDDEARDIRDLGFQQPVAVIPNAVDVPSIPCESTSDRRTAVFLSRIHPKKGLLNLIRAWAIVRPASWKLVIAGPDEQGHAGQIRDEIQRLRLLDTVQIRGEVSESEKLKFLAQSAFAVLPSESENFGMVVAEAMSVGVPVIASTGTPWSALRERGIGWWVPNSPEDLASAIRDAISLFPSELRDKGLAARSFVEENYSWEAVGTKTASFYRWLTGGGERPEFVFIHSAR